MEGNQYLHITISKCIVIENSLGVATYSDTYNIMYTILVGRFYHTILDEGPFYGAIFGSAQLHATFPTHTYYCIYILISDSAPQPHTPLKGLATVLQVHVRHKDCISA